MPASKHPPCGGPGSRPPPDGGYGWVVVACVWVGALVVGIQVTLFANYLPELADYFREDQLAKLGVIGSICGGTSFVVATLVAVALRWLPCRPFALAGSCIMVISLVSCIFSRSFISFSVTFGILRGIGIGMIQTPGLVLVQKYFTTQRPLAAGIAVSGLMLGQMSSPLVRMMMDYLTWQSATLVIAMLPLQAIVTAALMREPDKRRSSSPLLLKQLPNDDDANGDDVSEVKVSHTTTRELESSKPQLFSVGYICRSPRLWLLLLMIACLQVGNMAMLNFSPLRAVLTGASKSQASYLLFIQGLSSLLASLGSGILARCINRIILFSVAQAVACLNVLGLAFAPPSFAIDMVLLAVYGATFGIGIALMPTLATDLFGVRNMSTVMAFYMSTRGLVSFLCLPILGRLFDITGDFVVPYLVVAGITAIIPIAGLILYRLQRTT